MVKKLKVGANLGTRLHTIIFDNSKITPKYIAEKVLEDAKQVVIDSFKKENEEISDKIPLLTGSWYLEFSKPLGNMQMIFNNNCEDNGRALFSIETLAHRLSIVIPNVPFIYLWYSSIVDTGSCTVFENGKLIDETKYQEGDDAKNIDPVFNKYFKLGENAYKKIDNWFEKVYYHGQYSISSYSYVDYLYNKKKDIDFIAKEYKAIRKIIDANDKFTEIEKQQFGINTGIPYDFAKMLFKDFLFRKEGKYTSRMFSLTKGNLYSLDGAFLRDVVKEITPEEWFLDIDESRQDLEFRKIKKYGEKPKSYYLTKEELNTLTYEEQKKEAYKRREIAILRHDDYPLGGGFYTLGIDINCNLKKGDYIKIEDGIARVKDIFLYPDENKTTYVEAAQIYLKIEENNYRILEVHNLEGVTVLEESEVEDKYIIPYTVISNM